jgi:anti-anti-sigma factor
MPPETSLNVRVAHDGDEARLVLSGAFDVASAYLVDDELRRAIQHGARRLVLDMSHTRLLDMSGVRTLIEGARTARSHGARMSLAGVAGPPRALVDALSLQLLLGVE